MRHIDHGGAEPLMQRLYLGAHLDTEFCIQIGQRFIEEEDGGVANDGAAHRHALALSTRQLPGVAIEESGEIEDRGGIVHLLLDFVFAAAREFQRESHVVAHRHVRIERIGLEHHGDVPLVRFEIVDGSVADFDLATADAF